MTKTISRKLGREDIWTIRDILRWTSSRFASANFSSPLLDAQLLLCSVLNCEKIFLYTELDRPLSEQERSSFRELVQRRMSGEPVAYLLNKKYWHNLELFVDKRVLIPRPETESLLDFVLNLWSNPDLEPKIILDLCTGSGCLAISLARKWPSAKIIAVDISSDALDVAKENAQHYSLTNIEFIQQNLLEANCFKNILPPGVIVDIIVANPPYVSEAEWNKCEVEVKNYEPKLALVAKNDGLAIGESIYLQVKNAIPQSANSCFIMELGLEAPSKIINNLRIFSYNQPNWDLPQNSFFGLRDLTTRERFLCKISGLCNICK